MKPEAVEPRFWSNIALALLTFIWLLGIPYLLAKWVVVNLSSPNYSHGPLAVTPAGIAAVGAPAVAAIIASRTERRTATRVFTVGAILTLLLTVILITSIEDSMPPPPSAPTP